MTPVAEVETIKCFAENIVEVPDDLHVLTDGENTSVVEHGCFRIVTAKDGDKRIIWCRNVMAEISAAKRMFLDLITKGMVPYKVGLDGHASATVMKEFDPTAEEVIFMPVAAIAGG